MAERKTLIAVAAAGAVAVLVTAAVVVFGIRRVPPFPAVSDAPALEVPGTIAYLGSDDEGESCLTVVAASGGEPRTLLCAGRHNEVSWITGVAWTAQGEVVTGGHDNFGDEVVLVVDASSGEVVDRVVLDPPAAPEGPPRPQLIEPRELTTREDGAEIAISATREGTAEIAVRDSDGTTRTIVSADGPRDYGFTSAIWSPDGEWILVQDSEGRALVVGADGDPGPRVLLARDAGPRWPEPGSLAWFIPGDASYTVDPAELDRES